MMKSIRTLVRQDREKYVIPRRVQDVIPIQKIWEDGIFLTGGRYAKTFRFTDINYQVASEPDKEKMFRGYSALINSLDCGATTKITIFNHKMSHPDHGHYREYQGTAGYGYGCRSFYRPEAHVPDGDPQVSADGWTEHGSAHWHPEAQRLPHPDHGESCGVHAL